ncbi:hypothetical protein [Antrihabitans spumae]|uniref:Uncharacterized protein n=1 Tax=Antrihabitans spumae TaxID=3373370 RepID=A0ABW7KF86_9NOCA
MTVKDTPKNQGLGRILACVYTIAAAREDATPEQLDRLRTDVVPTVKANLKKGGNLTLVYRAIRDVMPAGWTPTGQWATAIANPLQPIAGAAQVRGLDVGTLLS